MPSGSGPNAFIRPRPGLAGRTRMLTGLGKDEALAALEAALDPANEDLLGEIWRTSRTCPAGRRKWLLVAT